MEGVHDATLHAQVLKQFSFNKNRQPKTYI